MFARAAHVLSAASFQAVDYACKPPLAPPPPSPLWLRVCLWRRPAEWSGGGDWKFSFGLFY